jgi:hypothetical protein
MEEHVIDTHADRDVLQQLMRRVTALEDNLAFLEVWCEEQQDSLDRLSEPVFAYERSRDDQMAPAHLRVVDLRDVDPSDDGGLFVDESEHERRVRLLRARISRVRSGLPTGSAS